MSDKFHTLQIKDVSKTTEDAVILTLDVPPALVATYDFIQGQYLTVKASINEENVQRAYSLCSSPLDKCWKVAVKKVPGGKFSTYANEVLEAGNTLEVMPPEGRFYVPIDTEKQRNYIAFAGGSGITPILSIVKTHLNAEPHSNFKLFFTNKNVASIMLKEELESLKNQFMDRFEIFYFLTQEQRNIAFFNGRMDQDKLDIIFKTIAELKNTDHFFLCGPEEMIFTVRDYLINHDIPKDHLHFELFTSKSEDKKQIIAETRKKFEGQTCHITVIEGGKTLQYDIAQGSENILDSALKNSADLPFACKGGVCCTCKAKLLDGEVNMLVNYGLEQDELDAGYILTCQSIPVSDNIKVDFDA